VAGDGLPRLNERRRKASRGSQETSVVGTLRVHQAPIRIPSHAESRRLACFRFYFPRQRGGRAENAREHRQENWLGFIQLVAVSRSGSTTPHREPPRWPQRLGLSAVPTAEATCHAKMSLRRARPANPPNCAASLGRRDALAERIGLSLIRAISSGHTAK
jgi:hypothetical protein